MNKRLVLKLLGGLTALEGLFMLPAVLVALLYGEDCIAFLYTMGITLVLGVPIWMCVDPGAKNLNAKDGLAVAGISWILMSFFGCLPFVFSGEIPSLIDAYFETVSGFTTTGASILTDVECMSRSILLWRSFTHWIGGMGVLVLTLALLPKVTGRTSHLARAESPGPVFSKLAPKMGDTAKILYLIYAVLTVLELICLLIAGMEPYDAVIHTFSTAGTGGFSCRNYSLGAYGPAVQWVTAVFMMLFGVNFAVYFHLLRREFGAVGKSEELWVYLGIVLVSTLAITVNILPMYGNDFGTAVRLAYFQVNTITSTTGFNTADFNVWPQFSRLLLVMLMVFGACGGSTAGGLKVSRLVMLFKAAVREVRHMISPRKVAVVRMEGKTVKEETLSSLGIYFFVYCLLLIIGSVIVSLDPIEGNNLTTSVTTTLTCMANVGPGMGSVVGPWGNFSGFQPITKIVLSLYMLAGRLEFYPMLVLISPALWRKN